MGAQFTPLDPIRCPHYAAFMSHLDIVTFGGLYWTLFLVVIAALFGASWIYQWTMLYKDKPDFDPQVFRKKLKSALAATTAIFLAAAAVLVVEVYALLALQFCDGEDLMSLYWATWTMLQLGSEIAVLGIVLALWHQIFNIRHPLWALALGTPVLVVAGIGHVAALFLEAIYKRCRSKHRRHASDGSSSTGSSSSASSIAESREDAASVAPAEKHESSNASQFQEEHAHAKNHAEADPMVFEIDVGYHNELVRQWPSFLGLLHGKAYVQMYARNRKDILSELEAQREITEKIV